MKKTDLPIIIGVTLLFFYSLYASLIIIAFVLIGKFLESRLAGKMEEVKVFNKTAEIFVPVVIILAILVFIIWYLVFGAGFTRSLFFAISVLLVSCPSAFRLAFPLAIVTGIGVGSEKGILVKDGETFEEARGIDIVVFDKAGILTIGKPVVTDVISFSGKSEIILQMAAAIESKSEHPLAKAIMEKAKNEKVDFESMFVRNFLAVPGSGVSGEINGIEVVFGNRRLMARNGYAMDLVDGKISDLERMGKTVSILAVSDKIEGLIAIEDPVKDEAYGVVSDLKRRKIGVVMMTGDNRNTAEAVATKVGIEHVIFEVVPEEKAREIDRLQESIVDNGRRHKIAFVGDEINDAPALISADLGIAMGSETSVTKEVGQIILVNNDIKDVVRALRLSSAVVSKIEQNTAWAFIYNLLGISIAAGALSFMGITLRPEIAGGAMALSSVCVMVNSLLLRKTEI